MDSEPDSRTWFGFVGGSNLYVDEFYFVGDEQLGERFVHELEKWGYGLAEPEHKMGESASRSRVDPHGSRRTASSRQSRNSTRRGYRSG